MNNRLDFISEFEDHELAAEEMSQIREKFIELDTMLKIMIDEDSAKKNAAPNRALHRAISLARTHIEQACMYSIKSLCLKHEKKKAE